MNHAETAKMFAQIDADGDRSVCVAELATFFKDRSDLRKHPDDYEVRKYVARKGCCLSSQRRVTVICLPVRRPSARQSQNSYTHTRF